MNREVSLLIQSQMVDLRKLFAVPLAARLGRPVEQVRDEGLGAGDFRSGECLELTLVDGSTMRLRYAFAVTDDAERVLGVFSEHCGYYVFATSGLELVELRDEVPVARRRWE